jgi:TonB family protein
MMHRLPIVTLALILLPCSATSLSGLAQDKNISTPAPSASATVYPDSQDGLKKFIEDVFGAMKSTDTGNISSYLSSLTIPDHNAWFMKVFGPVEGPRINAKYEVLLPKQSGMIRQRFEYAVSGGWTDITIREWKKPAGDKFTFSGAVMDAMTEPTPIYIANAAKPQEKDLSYIGDFIYVDGGFRYVNTEIFQALSTAPPGRIREGGNVAAATITRQVPPVYPAEARAAHTEGPVVLHVILNTEGKVRQVTAISGDPVLTKAAIDAVRQWEYKPTLLNGTPVEVDTTVTVTFRFR